MAFKQCPGDLNAYGFVWIDGDQHEIIEPDAVEIRINPFKLTDKGGGYFAADRSESPMLKVKLRKKLGYDRGLYESITCSTVQYQTKDYLYTLANAWFELDSENPGDGEAIEGTFHPGPGLVISSIPVSSA